MEAEMKKTIKETLDSFYVYYHNNGGSDARFDVLYAEALELLEQCNDKEQIKEIGRFVAIIVSELLQKKFERYIQ